MADEWKGYLRELQELRDRVRSGDNLPPDDRQRLEWLEERFGDAAEVERISIDEPVDSGPRIKTADHGYATEVSQKLLKQAEKYQPLKSWEKDARKLERAFEAQDRRRGQATFKQQGLSGFAVEATEDMKVGEIGLTEVPREEEIGAQKLDPYQAIHVQDESEQLTNKAPGAGPFALGISSGFSRGLEQCRDYEDSAVPDTAAKSFEVELDEDAVRALEDDSNVPARPGALLEGIPEALRKSYELPRENVSSEGELSTHRVGDVEGDLSTLELMRQAIDYAEKQGQVELEEQRTYVLEEDGNQMSQERPAGDSGYGLPDLPPPPPPARRFDDEKTTEPGIGAEGTAETVETMGLEAVIPPSPPPVPRIEPEAKKKKKRFSDIAPTRPGVAPANLIAETDQVPVPDERGAFIPDSPEDLQLIDEREPLLLDDQPMDFQSAEEEINVDNFWGMAEEVTCESAPVEPPTAPEIPCPAPAQPRASKPLPALSAAGVPPPLRRKSQADARPVARVPVVPGKRSVPPTGGGFQPVRLAPGPRKATVHFRDGVTRRGMITQVDAEANLVRLEAPPGSSAPPEDLVALSLKTIFLLLPRGAAVPKVEGLPLKLVLVDGRSLEGVTNDYDPQKIAFTLFPTNLPGNIERIIVYNEAVKNIWFQ